MPVTFLLPGGQYAATDDDPISIGTDAGCSIRLPADGRVQPRHAKVRRAAGRWLVESLGEWQVQVGLVAPSRLGWLQPGDVIRLSAAGPELVFQPAGGGGAAGTPAAAGPGIGDGSAREVGPVRPRKGPPAAARPGEPPAEGSAAAARPGDPGPQGAAPAVVVTPAARPRTAP